MTEKYVLVTGGFDPLHSGHIAYFKDAKQLGTKLVVGLNSDDWLTRKKGKPFMPFEERLSIIKELSVVDKVISFNDDDDTACGAIFKLMSTTGSSHKIVFANGGDRKQGAVPEEKTYADKIEFVYGVGGEDKKNSSSWILKDWTQPTTQRAWGTYTILDSGNGWKTKQLAFNTSKSLSDQRHFNRSEHWHVVEGEIKMDLEYANDYKTSKIYKAGDSIDIPKKTWHKAINVGQLTAKVIEVWLGDDLTEEDIERRD
jgi:cytidyltransferase-like protein